MCRCTHSKIQLKLKSKSFLINQRKQNHHIIMPNSGLRAFLFQFCQHTPPVHYTWPTAGSGLPWWSDVWAAIPEWAGVHQEEEGGEERASILEPWQAFSLSSRATGTHLELHCTVEVNPQHFFDSRDDVFVHGSPGQHCKPKPTTKRSLVSLRITRTAHFWAPRQCSAELWHQLWKSFCKIRPRLWKNRGTAVDLDIPGLFLFFFFSSWLCPWR